MKKQAVVLTRKEFAKKWQACLRKKKFKNKQDANKVVLKMQLKQTKDFEFLVAYRCSYENHWHIGHDML